MERKVEAFIKEHGMIKKDDVVIAGVSGGADSVCLLFVLCALREKLGFEIRVCHVNHGLRGADADADERYVINLCEKQGIPCRVFHEDVESIAKKWKQSTEEAGRAVRRHAFETMCRENGGTKIATAHHQGDNAETVLLNIARGTGLKGLCGIRPVDGIRIRPLLALTREEIEYCLKEKRILWCEDATNAEDDYTRNRIRHNILPALAEQVNPGVFRHLDELSRQAGEVWDYLERGTDRAWERCVEASAGNESLYIDCAGFKEEMPAIQKQLLRRCLSRVRGKEQDIGAVHVAAFAELFKKQTGRVIDLPGNVRARRVYGGVSLSRAEVRGTRDTVRAEERSIRGIVQAEELSLAIPGTVIIPGAIISPGGVMFRGAGISPETEGLRTQLKLTCRFVEKADLKLAEEFPQKSYTKWIDYDIIKHGLLARTRRSGDYFTIDGEGSRQKLKSFFVNEKIPQEDRRQVLLIADGEHIVWIPGRRMSRTYHISSTTKKVLEINITEE